jgi:hypothetical protein
MTYPAVGRLRANHRCSFLLAQIWIMTSKDGICFPDTEIRELPSCSVFRHVYSQDCEKEVDKQRASQRALEASLANT